MSSAAEAQMQLAFFHRQINRMTTAFETHYMRPLVDITFDIIAYEMTWQHYICSPEGTLPCPMN